VVVGATSVTTRHVIMSQQLTIVVACAALFAACLVVGLLFWQRGRRRTAQMRALEMDAPPPFVPLAAVAPLAPMAATPTPVAPRPMPAPVPVAPRSAPVAPRSAPVVAAPAVAPPPSAPPRSAPAPSGRGKAKLPEISYDEDDDVDPTRVGAKARLQGWINPPTSKIIVDDDSLVDEPTQSNPLILLTATAQTDVGLRRKHNEDSILALHNDGLFVVADGMGGYRGGEIASQLAVSAIARAFETQAFPGNQHDAIPRRASELARAIQAANVAILERAEQDRQLEGMGTTVCAIRFSLKKQRLFIGHVGDSRIYRLRAGTLKQMTADHTMRDHGVVGAGANELSRAVGIWPTVPIDIILGKPRPGDVYLLCSDGLTKMLRDKHIAQVLHQRTNPQEAVDELIRAANANGGKDNVSVVVVRVESAP
jgi:serine/threonine protein phosphatase PrpC